MTNYEEETMDGLLKAAREVDTGHHPETEGEIDPSHRASNEDASLLDSVGDFIRENPGPALLMGAGLAWMMVNQERRRARSLPERLNRRKERLKGHASEFSNQTQEAVIEAKSRATEHFESMRDRAQVQAKKLHAGYHDLLEENPLVLGACAVVAGLAIGLLIPPTSPENALMGEHRDSLMDQARQVVREARDATMRTVETAKTVALDQLEGIQEDLKEAAEVSLEEAKQAAQEELKGQPILGDEE